jgi:deaminated glutathione amidase
MTDREEGQLRVSCVQMRATEVKPDNLEKAERLVARAAKDGADLIVLPEHWDANGSDDALRLAAGPLEGETVDLMRSWARHHGVTLVGGSINESHDGSDKLFNTCVVVDGTGDIAAIYRKIHMFDVEVGGQLYRESDLHEPGDEPVTWDAADWTIGLTICYDLRFPELYRILALAGAELITVPANFTMFTGKDHWEILLRTRAVENQCFVVAANQWGGEAARASYGRSMIVDPWGIVLAVAPDEDTVVSATVDLAHLERVRRDLPALANRRPSAYHSPAAT